MELKERKKILKVAHAASLLGGKVALKYYRKLKNVSIKEGAGLVSEADRESESIIMKTVHKKYPNHTFLGEEGGLQQSKTGSEFHWVVDPLDGTTNYVHGFPFFCVSIALEHRGQVEVAVVHAPLLKYTFTAVLGGGAFLNNKPIHVSSTDRFEDSLLATGFSYQKDKILDDELQNFKVFAEKSRGVRRAGSAALDLCMVAMGVFDGFWERQLASWDTAAGALLVREAGGVVTSYDGQSFHHTMPTIAAGNPAMHKLIMKELKVR